MSYVAGWSAYYSGGKTFSSKDTLPTDLPQTGMLVWMLYFNDGTRRVLESNDRYFWHDNGSPDGIFANTDESAFDVANRYVGAHIIEGELVSDTEMSSTKEIAFRTKTA